MALQDKFDSAFADKLLKKALISPNKTQVESVANDNNYELTKSNLITISNSFTSLQNTFNKIYSHTLNVRNLHQYEEKRLANIKRENSIESKIAPPSSTPLSAAGDGSTLASTAATLDKLASSVDQLNEKMKNINLGGGGMSSAGQLADAIPTSSRTRLGRFAGRALGAVGIGLDVYGRYQEGQSAGQIAAGVGGGLAGAAALGQAGAALGALGGPAAPVTVPLGAFIGSAIGYFGGSYAGDAAYDTFNQRAMGGGVKANGAYLIGERGPEVLMLGGLSGRVIANGQRGKTSQSEKYLTAAADRSSRAAAKVIKGQPPGPTSYSSKLSNYLSSLFSNMPNWLNRIKDWLGLGNNGAPPGTLGAGQYAAIGDLSGVTGEWKNDAEFLTAVDEVARKYNIDANDLLGLIYNESAGTFDPAIKNSIGATGLFQFMPQYFDTAAIARMSRAEQVRLADERIFAANGLPRGANAGQLYAAVFLPTIARNAGWQGVLTREGERYYEANARDKQGRRAGLDSNKDGVIDFGDLASIISGHRTRMGLGPSPSLVGVMSTQGFVTPVSGLAGSGFRTPDRPDHEGLDFPIPAGSAVRAAKAGTIISARTRGGYGYTIDIDHGGGVVTRYAHLREYVRRTGAVQAGDIIAYSGGVPGEPGAGRTTGAHLHFEVIVNGTQVDPAQFLTGAAAPVPVVSPVVAPGPVAQQLPLPTGFRRVGDIIVTRGGSMFPATARRTQDVPGFMVMSVAAQQEIRAYFGALEQLSRRR